MSTALLARSSAPDRAFERLYRRLRLYTNFFQPQMKLIEKTRAGAKVSRRYDTARTPYRRVLASPDVGDQAKAALTMTFLRLNPVELRRQITGLQKRLLELAKRRKSIPPAYAGPDHPWRDKGLSTAASRASSMRQRTSASRAI